MPLDTLLFIKQNATMRSMVDEYTGLYKSEISDLEYYNDINYLISLKEALGDPLFAETFRNQVQAEKAQRVLQEEAERQMYMAKGDEVMQQLEPLKEWANSVAPVGNYIVGSIYGPKLTQNELNEVNEAVKQFVGEYITSDMTDLDKIITINEYLSLHCIYAEDWSKNRANTAWGALIYHEAQCSGYARATKALCDAVGIPCYYIHADTGSHQWNKVMIGENWYVVDITNSLSCLNMLFLVSDADYTLFTGDTSINSGTPIAENTYGKVSLSNLIVKDN
jgi:transglutaminase-like putative cysteine protease